MFKFFFLLLFPVMALASVEAEFAAFSNYIWRGTTFTENKPALQGEIDAEGKYGLYVSGFVTNAEFNDPVLDENAKVTQEIDYVVGKRWRADDWEVQVYYGYYSFPDAQVYDSDEFNLLLTYKRFTLELSYMDDYFGYQTNQYYARLGYEWVYWDTLKGGIFVGHNSFTRPRGNIIQRGTDQGLNGAGNTDYFDVFFANRKSLGNDLSIELDFNWTNRYEYSVDGGDITKERAKDFAAIVAFIYPFTL